MTKHNPAGSNLWTKRIVGRTVRTDDDNVAVAVGSDGLGDVVVAGTYQDSFLTVQYASNGTETWRRFWGERGRIDNPVGMRVAMSGEIYVVGSTHAIGQQAITTVKYSSSGDSLWTRHRGAANLDWWAYATAVVLLPSGVCVGGYYEHDYESNVDMEIAYDDAGNQAWTGSIDNSPGFTSDNAVDVTFDPAGNVISTGVLQMTSEYDELATAKYSPTGELLWLRTYHGFHGLEDEADKVLADSAGNVYVSGHSEGEGTGWDYVTIKYDADGNEQWTRRYDGPGHGDDLPSAMAVDRLGNVIVTGQSDGGPTYEDYATVKYSPSGQELWVRRYAGSLDSSWDSPYDLTVDGASAVYVTGVSRRVANCPAATIKYDAAGTVCWTNVCLYPDTSLHWFIAEAIQLDGHGNIYIIGFGDGPVLMAKLNPQGDTTWVRAAQDTLWSSVWMSMNAHGGSFAGSTRNGSCTVVAYDSTASRRWRQQFAGQGFYDGALAPDGVLFVATKPALRNSEFRAFDSLGVLRWRDSCSVNGRTIAIGPVGRVAIAGNRHSNLHDAFLTMLYEPHLGLCESPATGIPTQQVLVDAQPNPFARGVKLTVRSPSARSLSIGVYDRAGRLVRTLVQNLDTPGRIEFRWDGCDERGRQAPDGIYFAEVVARDRDVGSGAAPLQATVKVLKVQ